jgi:hypothetical protein
MFDLNFGPVTLVCRLKAEAEAERARNEAAAEVERQRLKAEAEIERGRLKAEAEQRLVEAAAESERLRVAAEEERIRIEAEAEAERERIAAEAEAERLRVEAQRIADEKAELERVEAERAADERQCRFLAETEAAAAVLRFDFGERVPCAAEESLLGTGSSHGSAGTSYTNSSGVISSMDGGGGGGLTVGEHEARVERAAMSDAQRALFPDAAEYRHAIAGAWTRDTAGGCYPNAGTWVQNAQVCGGVQSEIGERAGMRDSNRAKYETIKT